MLSLLAFQLRGVLIILVRMIHHIISLLLLDVIILSLELSVMNFVDTINILLMLNLHD